MMATADSVKAKMQGLIDSANAKTGAGDTTLTAAVNTLIAGFGSGTGGSSGVSGVYMAKITPEEDLDRIEINHNLGTTDILFAACWAETLGDIVPTFNGALGKYWAKTDIPVRYSSAGDTENFNTLNVYNVTNNQATGGTSSSYVYWDGVGNENTFCFRRAGSAAAKYIAGVTYTVIVVAANAEV